MRASSVISQADSEAILAKTDKLKTGGTFFFTADADTVQVLPQSRIDERIMQMYQRKRWEETQNHGPIQNEIQRIKPSISKLRYYDAELERFNKAKKHTQIREMELKAQNTEMSAA